MNKTEWCAAFTTAARNARCTTTSGIGTMASIPGAGAASWRSSRQNKAVTPTALTSTARVALPPKVLSMNALSQSQAPATIRTGGAA